MNVRRKRPWPEVARRLAESVPVARLHPAVRAWADGRGAAARGPWLLACSGGADSVALVLLVWSHWPERRRRLHLVHFDHRMRGRESREDAAFCRGLAAALGIGYLADVWVHPRKDAGETAAREARMAFFWEAMDLACSRALWLGHQADDVAESLFMRISRGSGIGGLAAPRPVQAMPGRRVHLRPLLGLTKAEIAGRLREAGGGWREDRSNAGDRYFRNRIRKAVIPAWIAAAAGRDALSGAVLSREMLEEADAALEVWLDEIDPLDGRGCLHLKKLAGRPRAVWRRALHRWLIATPYRGDLSRQGFENLLACAERAVATRQSMGSQGFAEIRGGLLRYRPVRSRQR